MVRHYIKKTARANIPEETIVQALRDISNSSGSIREVAQRYGLKKSMLHKRLKKLRDQNLLDIDIRVNKYSSKYSTQQIFTSEEEVDLEKYVIHSSKLQYGLTYFQFRKFAYEYASRLNKTIPQSWLAQKIAGIEWMKGFMRRHHNLSLRKPENTSLARNISFNRTNIDKFFRNLQDVFEKYKFTSDRIVNVDESTNAKNYYK